MKKRNTIIRKRRSKRCSFARESPQERGIPVCAACGEAIKGGEKRCHACDYGITGDLTKLDVWTRKLVLAVGQCIVDQKGGHDVLASASWDRVCEIWAEQA